ncbi:uncharacterized protein A1O5_07754 [Cladophialophora psammophila CBS 110553]|uniref:Xylanolytic transcriptional activator regulatory domain-containing protein n=1 Tax=Cladophialophora psammophila CBS 110553 TaxID=1182543 RepID=W9WLM2_9EURO|nr:uncharacterized protein A1O5_07754 [Cladophialophora psammophila CBS 110553]EXJ68823.1 hypothetical protein A1O5_07754 [Cladophialophora psammophila CBS 110553]
MNGRDFTLHEHMPKLPPRTHVEQYFDAYRNSPVSSIFPIADPVLFPIVVGKAYGENGKDRVEVATAKACVFSFLAFVSAISNPDDGAFPVIDIEECLMGAEILFPDILNARARTEVVDAMIMLAVYQFTHGHVQTADIVLTLASRFLYMLGAHLYPGEEVDGLPTKSPNLEIRTKLHQREMFWLCYTLDREITFRTGRPPIISDTSCDLVFPKYYSRQNADGFRGLTRLPGDLGLSLIKSKAYEKLYSPHALRKPDAEILKDIRELDDLLENWRQSLASETRPPLSFAQEAKQLPTKGLTIPSFMLRLEYHHCITTIHQASSRCRNWSHDRLINEGLSSSLDLALEASRSLLSYLHFAEHLLVPNLFWIVIFYPISAVLTLFCNILLNPASRSASTDAQSLREVLEFVETFLHRAQVFDRHLQHMKRLNEFIAELVEMAGSAIEQARRSPECNTP